MVKVLFCGDVNSEFDILTSRITSLNSSSHGPFDVVICAGRFFSTTTSSKDTIFSMPIPTYIMPYDDIDSSFTSIPENIFFMKESGLQTIAGLTVGTSSKGGYFTPEDLQILKDPGFRGCDVLITSDWPREFYHFLDEEEISSLRTSGPGLSVGIAQVSELVVEIKPRYHVTSRYDFFYQRLSVSINNICSSSSLTL